VKINPNTAVLKLHFLFFSDRFSDSARCSKTELHGSLPSNEKNYIKRKAKREKLFCMPRIFKKKKKNLRAPIFKIMFTFTNVISYFG